MKLDHKLLYCIGDQKLISEQGRACARPVSPVMMLHEQSFVSLLLLRYRYIQHTNTGRSLHCRSSSPSWVAYTAYNALILSIAYSRQNHDWYGPERFLRW